ncbi:MAG: SDR family oxidoreductase [Saprospirales bacterium]|nr:MAG: SDR family oxidoreductase [Saprospirales bacterium]
MKKNVLITGITSGIGLITANTLAEKNYDVTGLIRNPDKAEKLISEGKLNSAVKILPCDLASLKSVDQCVNHIQKAFDRIDLLINNAGGVFLKRETTEDDLEMTFAVNHLGHFALTIGLLDKLIFSKACIINVSSEAHRSGKLNFDDLQGEEKFGGWKAYADGKLCNIYFTTELHRRYFDNEIASVSLHPGVVRTNFFSPFGGFLGALIKAFSFLMVSPEKGAATQLYLAQLDSLREYSGKYFKNKKEKQPSKEARNQEAAIKLWEKSESLLKEKGFDHLLQS